MFQKNIFNYLFTFFIIFFFDKTIMIICLLFLIVFDCFSVICQFLTWNISVLVLQHILINKFRETIFKDKL